MTFNLNQIVNFALSLPDEQAARKLVARAINTADTVQFVCPNAYTNDQLKLIFSYDQTAIRSFEEQMTKEETQDWYRQANRHLYRESLIYSLIHDDHDNHAHLSQLATNENLSAFTAELKRLTLKQGVFIAERVCFVHRSV
jgi:hypothetical protein